MIAAALAVDGGVDAHELALGVDECPSGVPRVDGGVCLDEVFVPGDAEVVSPHGADDTEGDRLIQLKRIPDRQHPLGDPKRR